MVEGVALHELVFDNDGLPFDYLILDINPAFEKILSLKRETVVGKSSRDVYHVTNPPFIDIYSQVALTGNAQVFETYFEPLNKHFSISVYQTHINGFATVFEDITEKHQTTEQMVRNNERLQSIVDILQFKATQLNDFLDHALNELIRLTDSKIGYIYFYNADKKQFVLNSWSKEVLQECAVTMPETTYDLEKTGLWGEVLRQQKPIINNDFEAYHPLKKGVPEGHVTLKKFLSIPIFFDNEIVAVAGVANKTKDYTQTDVLQMTLLMNAVWKTTERLKLEIALQESKTRFEELVRRIPVGIYTLCLHSNRKADFLYGSEKFFQMLDVDKQEILQDPRAIKRHIHPDDRASLHSANCMAIQKITSFRWEGRFLIDCKTYWLRIESEPSLLPNGDIVWNGVIIDITERKQAEQALQENRNFLNNLLDSIPIPVFYKDQHGKYLGVNLAYESFIGKTKEELIGKTVFDISDPELAQTYHAKDQELFDNVGVQIYESQVKNVANEIRDVVFNKATLVDLNGNITGIVGAITDLTEHKQAEKALLLSEKKYRLIADNVSDVIWQMDAKTHRFTYISPSVERLTGYKAEEVLKYPFEWILTPRSQKMTERIIPILQSNYKQGEYETFVYELEHPCINGTTVWTETTTRYLVDEETGRLIVYGSARNITVRKKAQEEIVLKNKELQKVNMQKDKFFSIIAHDLKSPFNSIVGFSELLIQEINEMHYDEAKNYAEIILKSSERAMDLLLNLMEWTRSQTGRMDFNPEKVEMTSLITQIALFFQDIAGQKSIKIKKVLPHSAQAYCDKSMISTVLRNLVSNAIKFSRPDSEITISMHHNSKELIIIVKDQGVGIPKERIDQLFQIDKSISTEGTNHELGTGLGLILCKEFIEKHGGTIRVKSELERGSVFIISIPLAKPN